MPRDAGLEDGIEARGVEASAGDDAAGRRNVADLWYARDLYAMPWVEPSPTGRGPGPRRRALLKPFGGMCSQSVVAR